MSFLINIRLREFDELVTEAQNMSYEEFETNKAIDAFMTKIEEEIKKSFNISEFHTLSTKLEKYSIDELKRMADATAVIMKFTNKLPELFNEKRIQAKKEGKLIGFENVIIEMLNEPDGKKKIAKMISDAELLLEKSRVISNERRNMIEAQLNLMKLYHKKPVRKIQPKRNLLDIWNPNRNGNKKDFEEFIDFLKKEYNVIGAPFVSEKNGVLQWNKIPQRGWQQYMAGFVFTCIEKEWISSNYSSTEYVKILENTFNVSPNTKWFKSIKTNPPKENYLRPFRCLRSKI